MALPSIFHKDIPTLYGLLNLYLKPILKTYRKLMKPIVFPQNIKKIKVYFDVHAMFSVLINEANNNNYL